MPDDQAPEAGATEAPVEPPATEAAAAPAEGEALAPVIVIRKSLMRATVALTVVLGRLRWPT